MNYGFLVEGMTWSFSRVRAYLDCPYRFLLRYILCEPARDDMFFTSYGSFVHELIAGYLSGEYKKEDLVHIYARKFGDRVTEPAPTPAISARYYADGFNYFTDFDFPYTDIAAVEQKTKFSVNTHNFVGIIDCLAREGDDLILIDHKSRMLQKRSGKNPPLKRDAELDEYYRQLYLYCKPVYEMYGRFPKRLEFNCFRSGTLISEPFDAAKYSDTLAWFDNIIKEIAAKDDWPAKVDAFACANLCEMNGGCEYAE